MVKFAALLALAATTAFATETEGFRQGGYQPQGYATQSYGGYGYGYEAPVEQSYGRQYAPLPHYHGEVVEAQEEAPEAVAAEEPAADDYAAPAEEEVAEAPSAIGTDGYLINERTARGPYETIYAKCALKDPEEENTVRGTLFLTQKPGGNVVIDGSIGDLSPGKHGFHIHELGDGRQGCASTGGHYNPAGGNHVHGSYGGHAGDLEQADADHSGVAKIWQETNRFDLYGTFNVVGRSMVVHKKSDEEGAGPRIACCTIGLTAPPKQYGYGEQKW